MSPTFGDAMALYFNRYAKRCPKGRTRNVRNIVTGETALGVVASKDTIFIQMDNVCHPQAYGWHPYNLNLWQELVGVKPDEPKPVLEQPFNMSGNKGWWM